MLQGIIHVAVCFEQLRRGNARGALSQWRKAEAKLGGRTHAYGVDVARWCETMRAFLMRIDLAGRAGGSSAPLPEESAWPVPPE